MNNGNQPITPILDLNKDLTGMWGLTKREQFAAIAMQGQLANSYESEVSIKSILSALNLPEDTKYLPEAHYPRYVSQWAVSYADALLKQLEQ